MDVEIADKAGACYGVNRALELARAASRSEGPVHTLGPLIHNPRVVADLEAAGVGVAHTLEEAREGVLVLRSHGTAPETVQRAKEMGFEVVDATCPYVAKVQRTARQMADDGCGVIIIGEAGHAEVESIRAWGADAVVGVVESPEQLPETLPQHVGVVVQTTQSQARVDAVVEALSSRVEDLRVAKTVCLATQERQKAACELASRVDVMLVVGGRNSGNTRRLVELCGQLCARTYHIEDSSEVDPAWFDGASACGITAGASTPASHIDAVEERVRAI